MDYLSRRIVESEHETVRQQWNKASLEKSVSEIHERQQDKEKHTLRRFSLKCASIIHVNSQI